MMLMGREAWALMLHVCGGGINVKRNSLCPTHEPIIVDDARISTSFAGAQEISRNVN